MVKSDIDLGVASKQNALFQKMYPKNTPMLPMSRIGLGF